MFHLAPHSTLNTSTVSLSSTSIVLLSASSPDLLSTHPFIHREDPRQDGTSEEFHSSTGYDPNRIELNRILVNPQNQMTDGPDDIEKFGVKPLSYSQSLSHLSLRFGRKQCDAAPTRTLKKSNYVRCWLHNRKDGNERKNEGQARACHSERESLMIQSSWNREVSGRLDAECVQKREAIAQRTQAYHSRRESLMTSSSRDLEVSGKLDAVFSCHSESSQHTFSERDRCNESGNRFESSVRSVFRFADPANVGKYFLMETRIICLIEQGLNLCSRNIKWDLLTLVSMSSSNPSRIF